MCPFIPAEKAQAAEANKISSVEILSADDWTVEDGSAHSLIVLVTAPNFESIGSGDQRTVTVNLELNGNVVGSQKIKFDEFKEDNNWQVDVTFSDLEDAGSYVAKTVYGNTDDAVSAVYTVAQGGGVVTSDSDFANGTVTQAVDNTGRTVSAGEDGAFAFAYDGSAHWVVPQVVTTAVTGQRVNVQQNVAGDDDTDRVENITYFKDSNKNGQYDQGVDQPVTVKSSNKGAAFEYDITEAGTYFVVSKSVATYSSAATNVAKFVITAGSLSGATAYQGNNVGNTTFTFNGKDQIGDFKFALNGTKLTSDDYDVAWYNADGSSASAVKNAGTYTARLTGKGAYAGSTANVAVVVNQLDLADAAAYVDDIRFDGTEIKTSGITVESAKCDGLDDLIEKTISGAIAEVGAYSVTITPAEVAAPNVQNLTGSATVSFNVVSSLVGEDNFLYDGDKISLWSETSPYKSFDMASSSAFDASEISVARYGTINYPTSAYTVTITDEDGNVVAAPNATGTYTLTVAMNPGADFAIGGKIVRQFEVTNGNFANAVVTALYDGKLLSGQDITYTGEDVAAGIELTVSMNGTALVAGTDYDVKYTDVNKEEVDSVVNKGAYYLVITPKTFSGSEVAIDFNVVAVTVKALKVDDAALGGIAYTGSAIQPTILYSTKSAAESKDSDYKVLDSSLYSAAYVSATKDVDEDGTATYTPGRAVSEVVNVGSYGVTPTLYGDVANYEFDASIAGETLYFDVIEAAAYADVSADAWYAGVVYTAASDGYGYMTGIPGTKLFMPEASITRAQTAQVLYNMAGGDLDGDYYETGFSDVPGYDWAAKAVFWASQAGVVTGYPGTGLFGASDEVTREQAATMLYRYVKAQGKDVSATADLSAYTDGASVSDWAAEAMQWAVANDVFGVNTDTLRPQEDLSRAEMAAIAVRVQPDGAIKAL